MMKLFYDPIYGQIHIDEWEFRLINLPELSKYRFIRMTGLLYMTFHSSNHTRFESIIGTLHLCELLRYYYEKNEILRKKYKKKYRIKFEDITSRDWFLLKLSLILKNLQHFCFSQPFLDAIERLDSTSREIFFTKGLNTQKHLEGAIENFLNKKDAQDIIKDYFKTTNKKQKYDENQLKKDLKEVLNKRSEIVISPLVENVLPLSRIDYYARDSYYSNGLIAYNAKKILNGFIGISKNETNSTSKFNLIFKIDVKSELEKFYYQRIYMYINYYSNPSIRKYETVFENLIKFIIENRVDSKILMENKSKSRSGIDDFFLMFIIEDIKERRSKSDPSPPKLINYTKFKSLFKEPLRLSTFINRDYLLKKDEVVEIAKQIYALLKDKTKISLIEAELISKLNDFCSDKKKKKDFKFEQYDILLDVNAPRIRKSVFENIKFIELKNKIKSNDETLSKSEREKNLINFKELDQISNQYYIDNELKLDLINVYYHEEMENEIIKIKIELILFLSDILVDHLFSNSEKNKKTEKKMIKEALSDIMKELVIVEKEESNIIYDPVYGVIELYPWEIELLEINEIKRLKWIRQQSLINFSFPGAVHTRFEHSLGTLYIGERIFKKLIKKNPMLKKAKNLNFLFRLSCLFHDIGHGPFSHLTEKLIRRNFESYKFTHLKKSQNYSHEVKGEELLRLEPIQTSLYQILKKNEEGLKNLGFIDNTISITTDFITDLCIKMGAIIADNDTNEDSEIDLLKDLLCGGIDADRIDYLIRDSHYTGVGWGSVKIDNIIEYMGCKKIYENDEKDTFFLEEIDGLIAIETLLYLRNLEASKIFNEKYGRLCEKLIINTIESKDSSYIESFKYKLTKMNDYMLFKDFFNFEKNSYSVLIKKLYNENIFEYYVYEIKLTNLRYNWRKKVESSKSEFKIKELEEELKDYFLKKRTKFLNKYSNTISDDNEKEILMAFFKKLEEDYLLISIPKIPRQRTENILIKINNGYRFIEDISPLIQEYKKSYRTFWTLNVYYCQKLDKIIEKFIDAFLDSFLKS